MRYYINPERRKRTISFTDHIVYSRTEDLNGDPLELELSVMSMNGGCELSTAAAGAIETGLTEPQPAIVWLSGGGYRGADKNQMIAELQYLAEAGYAVVMVCYRSSAQGHWPDPLTDVKTAVRFLRAHADQYFLDPKRIGVMGKGTGGHLAAMTALNLPGYDSEEWGGYSSEVQAGFDMSGPVNIVHILRMENEKIRENPHYRCKTLEETHIGALMGGDPETMIERAKDASAIYRLPDSKNPAPLLIMHGDADWLVPPEISDEYYDALVDAGYGEQTDMYLIHGAGHGTPEFFQPQVREIVKNFFKEYLWEKNMKL